MSEQSFDAETRPCHTGKCSDCQFFKNMSGPRSSHVEGECRVDGPQLTEHGTHGIWPRVRGEEWCRHFQERTR
jgi:hypothetical protein